MIYTENILVGCIFFDEFRINIFDEDISDQLIFTDTFRQNQHVLNFQDFLALNDRLDFGFVVSNHTITDTLSFTDKFKLIVDGCDIYDNLFWVQSYVATGEQFVQSIELVDVFDADIAIGVRDELEFIDSFDDFLVIHETIIETIEFVSSHAQDIDIQDVCIPSSVTRRGYIELEHSGLIVRLWSPEFNNIEETISPKVANRLRGNVTNIVRAPLWTNYKKHTVTVSYSKDEEFVALRNLLRASIGQSVIWRDHENNTRNVIILNPGTALSEISIFNKTVTLELVE